MRGWSAVYYREILVLRRRLTRLMGSMAVSPLLYMIAFGCAMGDVVIEGRSYVEFLIPGLVAMASMTQAWAIASEINIARFYWRIFEEFQAAPIGAPAYVSGEVLAGVTRACLSMGVILVLGALFGVRLDLLNIWFWVPALLNAALFASLAVALAMLVKSHADQAMMSNFVITPMAFLGGTFFPLERLPDWAQGLLQLLPLSHASKAIRAAAFGQSPDPFSYLLLAVLALGCFGLALACVGRARD
jgi:Nod factor-specific ABC transporter NodJ protein